MMILETAITISVNGENRIAKPGRVSSIFYGSLAWAADAWRYERNLEILAAAAMANAGAAGRRYEIVQLSAAASSTRF